MFAYDYILSFSLFFFFFNLCIVYLQILYCRFLPKDFLQEKSLFRDSIYLNTWATKLLILDACSSTRVIILELN